MTVLDIKELMKNKKFLNFSTGQEVLSADYKKAYSYLLKVIHDKKYGNYTTFPADMATVNEIHRMGKVIHQYLCVEAKQIYSNGFVIKFTEEVTDNIGKNIVSRKFICINRERFNPINFLV